MRKYNSKSDKENPIFKVLGLLILSISILVLIQNNKEKEIKMFGVNNSAEVKNIEFVSFIDNAKSQQRISFYRIKIQYRYDGSSYSRTLELQPQEYKITIGRKLIKGDKISIEHSSRNPTNVKIKEKH
ncbi:hypothetical protein [Marinifilum sp. D737]|uniref:hypothetical protein n=1 Tax=Marinifilum sp. D737 TaxID=2969628 RepID=UPI002272A59A|nr:hypothetical protein [Marinifilum sp. D737]MCY1632871.1 hypothetical protein [Marinifilum sp. D737]